MQAMQNHCKKQLFFLVVASPTHTLTCTATHTLTHTHVRGADTDFPASLFKRFSCWKSCVPAFQLLFRANWIRLGPHCSPFHNRWPNSNACLAELENFHAFGQPIFGGLISHGSIACGHLINALIAVERFALVFQPSIGVATMRLSCLFCTKNFVIIKFPRTITSTQW